MKWRGRSVEIHGGKARGFPENLHSLLGVETNMAMDQYLLLIPFLGE
jgi:hypothetical protein